MEDNGTLLKEENEEINKKKMNRIILISAISLILLIVIVVIVVNTKKSKGEKDDSIEELSQIYFLSTQGTYSNVSYSNNEAILIKSKDNKLVMIDTANEDEEIVEQMIHNIKNFTKSENPTIEYLIISHMHKDHYGGAVGLMNHSDITIKNLIIKPKTWDDYKKIEAKANEKNITIINPKTAYQEGDHIMVGNLKLVLFNLVDIYKESKNNQLNAFTFLRNNKENGFQINETYVVKKGCDAEKLDYLTEEEIEEASKTSEIFYATKIDRKTINENSNSITVLVEIQMKQGKKFVYIPSDLENNGYPSYGEYDENYKIKIYGSDESYSYLVNEENGTFITDKENIYKSPNEYLTSLKVKDYIEKQGSKLTDIVIYQDSHHGINNAQDALNVLGFTEKEREGNVLYRVPLFMDFSKQDRDGPHFSEKKLSFAESYRTCDNAALFTFYNNGTIIPVKLEKNW